jgi:hypothetical protein
LDPPIWVILISKFKLELSLVVIGLENIKSLGLNLRIIPQRSGTNLETKLQHIAAWAQVLYTSVHQLICKLQLRFW